MNQPMALTDSETLVTGEALFSRGDIGPCELIEGRIKPISPTGFRHGQVEVKIAQALNLHAQQRALGIVISGEVGIYIRRNPDTVRAADVAFISHARLAGRHKLEGYLDVAPELVVEVLSPDDAWSDVMRKLRDYFSAGVQLVWVADPSSRSVHAYRSLNEVREFASGDTLTAAEVLADFSVAVAELFEG